MSPIDDQQISRLFAYYSKNYDAASNRNDPELLELQKNCNMLFAKDYETSIIPNHNGEYCVTYPLELVIIERSKHSDDEQNVNDADSLKSLFFRSRFARVRARFPVPVILFRGKNICRSSTLSQKAEFLMQHAGNQLKMAVESAGLAFSDLSLLQEDSSTLMERIRSSDVFLINVLGVRFICDLMTENKKTKFGLKICSSEKVDMHDRYSRFVIASIPYPGVEFFKQFNEKNHCAQDLYFDWPSNIDSATLSVVGDPRYSNLLKMCKDYKNWDLIALTQNYLKFLLQLICDGEQGTGLLVHCISGWDRTPLFISLIRLLLWAEGFAHETLTAKEMLFLTVGYDWMLFRHQVIDRRVRGEDIFYFCFYFLDYVLDEAFSIEHISSCLAEQKEGMSIMNYSEGEYPIRDRSDSFTEICCTPPLSFASSCDARVNPIAIPSRKRSDSEPQFGNSWQLVDSFATTEERTSNTESELRSDKEATPSSFFANDNLDELGEYFHLEINDSPDNTPNRNSHAKAFVEFWANKTKDNSTRVANLKAVQAEFMKHYQETFLPQAENWMWTGWMPKII
eukprot:TRINITY_DN8145_c0_g1_i1.p1 TRINITY_DN8145_c0_g1~~TRINITY_DN8145_c0_g1_i1.p1  ORF type:complete len:567 (-),score=131.08 TRINITY_DN8145_c0_g1_i1:295-1995(-)